MTTLKRSTFSMDTRIHIMRIIGVILASATVAIEGGCILFLIVTGRTQNYLAILLFLAAGGIFGLLPLLMWCWYSPSTGFPDANNDDTSDYIAQKRNMLALSTSSGTINMQEPIATNMNIGASHEENKQYETKADLPDASSPPFLNSYTNAKYMLGTGIPGNEFPETVTANVRSFVFPKEGDDPSRCEDKYSTNTNTPLWRFAVTDGAGASFLPAQWAQIVATSFAEAKTDFKNQVEFTEWLTTCSQQWHWWLDETWIPSANEQLGQNKDWSRDRERGAQTTLIGCSFSYHDLVQTGRTDIQVTAVGDANFFLVRPPQEGTNEWIYYSFANQTPEEFGPVPDTLATSELFIRDAWTLVKRISFPAQRGDFIILTTDALAKWILASICNRENPWIKLLHISEHEAFREFVIQERSHGNLEIDDTTSVMIRLK